MSLDVSVKFLANTRQAIQAINDFKSKVSRSMDSIANNVADRLFMSDAIDAFAYKVKNAVSEIYGFGDFSRIFRLPVDEVKKFTNAISILGGNTNETLNLIGQFQNDIAQLRTEGTGRLVSLAPRTGINLGAVKDWRSLFNEIRRVYRYQNESGKRRIIQEFGLNLEMVKLLEMSNKEYSQLLDKAEKMTIPVGKSYNLLDQIRAKVSEIRTGFSEASQDIINDANPALEFALNLMEKITNISTKTKKGLLYGLLFAGMSPIMLRLLPLLIGGVLLNPLSWGVGAGIATYAYWDDIVDLFSEAWLKVFEGFDWLKEKWNGVINNLKDAWESFTDIFENLFSNMLSKIDKIKQYWDDIFNSDKPHYGTIATAIKSPVQGGLVQQAVERSMANNGMMLQGNTFNVSILGTDNPFEMYKAFEIGVTNEVNGIGGFK